MNVLYKQLLINLEILQTDMKLYVIIEIFFANISKIINKCYTKDSLKSKIVF